MGLKKFQTHEQNFIDNINVLKRDFNRRKGQALNEQEQADLQQAVNSLINTKGFDKRRVIKLVGAILNVKIKTSFFGKPKVTLEEMIAGTAPAAFKQQFETQLGVVEGAILSIVAKQLGLKFYLDRDQANSGQAGVKKGATPFVVAPAYQDADPEATREDRLQRKREEHQRSLQQTDASHQRMLDRSDKQQAERNLDQEHRIERAQQDLMGQQILMNTAMDTLSDQVRIQRTEATQQLAAAQQMVGTLARAEQLQSEQDQLMLTQQLAFQQQQARLASMAGNGAGPSSGQGQGVQINLIGANPSGMFGGSAESARRLPPGARPENSDCNQYGYNALWGGAGALAAGVASTAFPPAGYAAGALGAYAGANIANYAACEMGWGEHQQHPGAQQQPSHPGQGPERRKPK